MNELWAIAIHERLVFGTNAETPVGAWHRLYQLCGVVDLTRLEDFVAKKRERGYSAVRLRYEIVERDGEVR